MDKLLSICKKKKRKKEKKTYVELDIVISYLEKRGKDTEVYFRIQQKYAL